MQLKLNTDRIIGLYAPQKYGKTTIMHWLAEQYSQHIPVYIYDTDMERYRTYSDLHKNVFFTYPKNLSDIESQEFFNKTILYLRSKYSNIAIFVEDIDKIIQSKIKSKDTLEIYKLASDSRHQRIAVVYSSKTPSYIPTTLRLNTNLFFFGKFVEPDFVKWITTIVPRDVYAKIKKPEFVMLDVWTSEYAIVRYNMDTNAIEEVGV